MEWEVARLQEFMLLEHEEYKKQKQAEDKDKPLPIVKLKSTVQQSEKGESKPASTHSQQIKKLRESCSQITAKQEPEVKEDKKEPEVRVSKDGMKAEGFTVQPEEPATVEQPQKTVPIVEVKEIEV